MTDQNSRSSPRTFRRSYWQPPRAHGEAIEGRSVSFLELFYDLVYVVVIAEAAHHLAEHVTWRGVGEFAVVFGMIWLAWMNGTIYYDLHGREDGRTRTFVFIQMALLALLAVFTGDAVGDDGPAFATVYAIYFAVFTWLWYTVQRQDDPRFRGITRRWLVGMAGSTILIAASAFVNDEARLVIWALFLVGWLVGNIALDNQQGGMAAVDINVTESMIERFGLFTIIVLGEVVVAGRPVRRRPHRGRDRQPIRRSLRAGSEAPRPGAAGDRPCLLGRRSAELLGAMTQQ